MNKECFIDVSTILAAPYNYDGGDSIWAKVSATNIYGESDQSIEGNDAYYTEVPDAPISLAENIAVRTTTTDGLTWSNGLEDGGQPVIDYRVNRRELGDVDYIVVATGVTTQSHTVTDLVLGTTYEFTVESRNLVGYSLVSASLTILHAIPPNQPDVP